MTYLVGWSPYHRDPGALELACSLARCTGESLFVVCVVPTRWPTSVTRRVDREAAREDRAEGERACAEAEAIMAEAEVEGTTVWLSGRSVPQVLLAQVEKSGANLLVLGSGRDGSLGQISVSSKASRVLHSCPVAVALAPRGYRTGGEPVGRVTAAFRDEGSSRSSLLRSGELAREWDVPLRVVTFGVEPRRMYPSEVGNAERMVFEEWLHQADDAQRAAVDRLDSEGALPPDVERFTVAGRSWSEAVDQVEWRRDDLLTVGSSSTHALKHVFLGSSAAKIVRHAVVPVVVMP